MISQHRSESEQQSFRSPQGPAVAEAVLLRLLESSGCAPWVMIEVTESAPLSNLKGTVYQLQRFRGLQRG